MKLLLVNPTNVKRDWGHSFPPLGLAYIAAAARAAGAAVAVHDRDQLFGERPDLVQADEAFRRALLAERPDLLGLSATTATITDAYRVARLARTLDPQLKIVVGGVHVTALPETTLRECAEIDCVICGEGEATIAELVRGRAEAEIEGLVYRSGGRIILNHARPPLAEIDRIEPPARDLLDMKKYTARSKHLIRGVSLRGTSVFTSRGCPYQCSFCCGPLVFGRGVRFHSVGYVVDEIASLVDTYKVEGIYFSDDMFASDRRRAVAICDELIRRGLHRKIVFAVQLKTTAVDEALLAKLKAAGCIQAEYGFESGSQRVLDQMNKKVKLADGLRAAELTRRAGLRMLGNFITGMPQETEADLRATIDYMKKVKPDIIGLYKLVLLPGSKLYLDQAEKFDEAKNWELSLVDDLTTNYTAMETKRFIRLFAGYTREIARLNAVRYLAYHFRKNPWLALGDLAGIITGRLGRLFSKFPFRQRRPA